MTAIRWKKFSYWVGGLVILAAFAAPDMETKQETAHVTAEEIPQIALIVEDNELD